MNEINKAILDFSKQHSSLTEKPFAYNDVTQLITSKIPELLYAATGLKNQNYKIYGSVGTGNWAEIVWIAILDRRITESTTKGYYIVFLFDKNLDSLYLCLSLGWTQFEEEFGVKEGRRKIEAYRDHYSSLLNKSNNFDSQKINLKADNNLGKGYELGTIVSKKYAIEYIESANIEEDLNEIIDIYDELKSIVGDSVLNVVLDVDIEEETVKDFSQEIAQSTFKKIDKNLIDDLLEKTKNKPREIKERMIKQVVRNKKFATYIKQRQNYICEVCSREPFIQKNGQPYAEADHIKPLGGQSKGLDTPENLRCLCAQCHAIITYGSDDEIRKILE